MVSITGDYVLVFDSCVWSCSGQLPIHFFMNNVNSSMDRFLVMCTDIYCSFD